MAAIPMPAAATRTLALEPLTSEQRSALRALPPEIITGLRILRDEPAPSVTRPDVWDEIARDAIMLAAEGWAGQALQLGWSVLELFGCAADPHGDDGLLGLAGRLGGRRVVAITDQAAHVGRGTFRRGLLPHRLNEVTLLWSYGR